MHFFAVLSPREPLIGSERDYELAACILERKSPGEKDSGHNSLHSRTTDTNSSEPGEGSFVEEDKEDYTETLRLSPQIRIRPTQNTNIIEVRYRGECHPDQSSWV